MKKINAYINEDLSVLELESDIDNKLRENNIVKINDLWCKTKKELKDLGFMDKDIKYLSIRLQLIGLDLNKKVY